MDAAEALDRFHEGTLRGAQFLRVLLVHERWSVPVVASAGEVRFATRRAEDGGEWLAVYTSIEPGGLFVTMPTRGWVEALTPALAGVDVDPGTPRAVHYRREQFGLLREWCRALDVEAVLARRPVPRSWATLRDHVWRIALTGHDEDRQLVLAPDAGGRRLAAVFTAADAAEAFVEGLPGVRVEARAGRQLFADLLRAGLDGIVFNPAGPSPVAVNATFAETVLDGVDPIEVPAVLPSRSRAEAELYLDVLGCEDRRARVEGDTLVVDGALRGEPRTFIFSNREEPAPTGFGGATPSRILDPAAFLLHSEALADADPDPADPIGRRAAAARLERAARCLEEVLKFIPGNGRLVPLDAFFSSAGRRLGRTEPERFSRAALETRLAALRARLAAL